MLPLHNNQSFGHVTMSSKNWFGRVKMYSLLDKLTSRNLSTTSVEYVNVLLTLC